MEKQRYLGMTGTQLNSAFLLALVAALGGAAAWLFVLGGGEQVGREIDQAVDEVRLLGADLGVESLRPARELPPTDTSRPISNEELAGFVPTQADFGLEYAGFVADEDNGIQNIDSEANDGLDPAEDRADLERFGYVSSYDATFSSPAATVLGTTVVGGYVMIFQTGDGAKGALDDSEQELVTYNGRSFGSITVLEASVFDVDIGSDQELGSEATVRFLRDDGTYTDVWLAGADYRIGRVVGSTTMAAIGPGEFEKDRLREKVEGVARTMAERTAAAFPAATPISASQLPPLEGDYAPRIPVTQRRAAASAIIGSPAACG